MLHPAGAGPIPPLLPGSCWLSRFAQVGLPDQPVLPWSSPSAGSAAETADKQNQAAERESGTAGSPWRPPACWEEPRPRNPCAVDGGTVGLACGHTGRFVSPSLPKGHGMLTSRTPGAANSRGPPRMGPGQPSAFPQRRPCCSGALAGPFSWHLPCSPRPAPTPRPSSSLVRCRCWLVHVVFI